MAVGALVTGVTAVTAVTAGYVVPDLHVKTDAILQQVQTQVQQVQAQVQTHIQTQVQQVQTQTLRAMSKCVDTYVDVKYLYYDYMGLPVPRTTTTTSNETEVDITDTTVSASTDNKTAATTPRKVASVVLLSLAEDTEETDKAELQQRVAIYIECNFERYFGDSDESKSLDVVKQELADERLHSITRIIVNMEDDPMEYTLC